MSESISPNTTIAQYTIVSKIGEGCMGEVYRARDTKLGRDVAIKVLPASLSENADRLNRFEQEAQAAGALNHPNILSIYHIGTHAGAPYIVSELLAGETLRERLGSHASSVPLPQRKAILRTLAPHGSLSRRRPNSLSMMRCRTRPSSRLMVRRLPLPLHRRTGRTCSTSATSILPKQNFCPAPRMR
jgi:serine/threonine protein kinase